MSKVKRFCARSDFERSVFRKIVFKVKLVRLSVKFGILSGFVITFSII